MAMAGVQDKQMRIPTNWLDADKCRTGDDFAHWQLDTSNSTLCLPDVVAAAAGSVVQSSPMERRPPLLSTRTMNWKCVLNCSSMFTFRVKCSRGENTGHDRPSVCLCVSLSHAACPHYCTDPDVSSGNDRRCPLVVHYWADLQSVQGFRCYDNIARTRNVSECLYSLCAWFIII